MVYSYFLDRVSHYWRSYDDVALNTRVKLSLTSTRALTAQPQPKYMWDDKPAIFPWVTLRRYPKAPLSYEDSNFVGNQFKFELVETYYRTCTFSIAEDDLIILDRFLTQDPFRVGLKVCDNICRIELTFKNHASSITHHGSDKQRRRHVHHISKWLDTMYAPLAKIKNKCYFTFGFPLKSGSHELIQWGINCEALLPVIRRIEQNECVVAIEVSSVFHYQRRRTWVMGPSESLSTLVEESLKVRPQPTRDTK